MAQASGAAGELKTVYDVRHSYHQLPAICITSEAGRNNPAVVRKTLDAGGYSRFGNRPDGEPEHKQAAVGNKPVASGHTLAGAEHRPVVEHKPGVGPDLR